MKIFLSQQNYHIGNFEYNTAKIISAIEQAKLAGGDLIIFSELSVCGYPPRDFLYFKDFIEKCEKAIEEIAKAAQEFGIDLWEHVGNVILAMRTIAPDLGLAG